jgi:hypothetical protein
MGYGIEKIILSLPRIELRTLSPLPVAIATERTMAATNILVFVVALRQMVRNFKRPYCNFSVYLVLALLFSVCVIVKLGALAFYSIRAGIFGLM